MRPRGNVSTAWVDPNAPLPVPPIPPAGGPPPFNPNAGPRVAGAPPALPGAIVPPVTGSDPNAPVQIPPVGQARSGPILHRAVQRTPRRLPLHPSRCARAGRMSPDPAPDRTPRRRLSPRRIRCIRRGSRHHDRRPALQLARPTSSGRAVPGGCRRRPNRPPGRLLAHPRRPEWQPGRRRSCRRPRQCARSRWSRCCPTD